MHFWNFKEDFKKKRLDAIYLVQYRERLFPFLIKCYLMNESSIAAFTGPYFKTYDSDGNVYQDICLHDLDVLMNCIVLAKKKLSKRKMVVFEDILKDFLEFSFELNQITWCADGEEHTFEWCGGTCTEIKFLLPIIEEMKKHISMKEKNFIL